MGLCMNGLRFDAYFDQFGFSPFGYNFFGTFKSSIFTRDEGQDSIHHLSLRMHMRFDDSRVSLIRTNGRIGHCSHTLNPNVLLVWLQKPTPSHARTISITGKCTLYR